MGFEFWKKEQDFKVSDHIRLYKMKGEIVSEKESLSMRQNLMNTMHSGNPSAISDGSYSSTIGPDGSRTNVALPEPHPQQMCRV